MFLMIDTTLMTLVKTRSLKPAILDKNFGTHFENRYRFRFLRFPPNFHPLSPSAMLRMEDTLINNLQHCTGGEGVAVFGKFLKIAGVPIYFVQGCRAIKS